jgi:hypothetical protein
MPADRDSSGTVALPIDGGTIQRLSFVDVVI